MDRGPLTCARTNLDTKGTWTSYLEEETIPLIVDNLHHSIDYNWIGPDFVGEAWLGPDSSKWTVVKYEWLEGKSTALDHLRMERQSI